MKRHNLKTLGFLLLLIGLGACAPAEKTSTPLQKPNIIYVLTDDLGYGDLSVFNADSKISTPNIDKLAAEGMMFTDAHTSSAVCTPTRYGILTGRYNWRSKLKSGVLGGKSKALIPSSRTTVASLLKTQGYATAYIGKWHLGWDWALKNDQDTLSEFWDKDDDLKEIDFSKPITNGPKELGFEYSYGHCGSLDMAPYVYVENGMPTEIPTEITESKGDQNWWRKGLTSSDFVHEDVTPNFFRRAISYVKEQAKEDKPFFLYLPLPSPHTPILPTEEFQGKSGLDNPYGDFVLMIDAYMGQLLAEIKASGIEDNTLIVFTSDNGCSPEANIEQLISKGHHPSGIYRGHKADIFEGGHRVPFIVKWPNVIEAGATNEQPICTTDFMATVATISGYTLKDNEAEDSFDMMPLLTQTIKDDSFREGTIHHSVNGSFAIRKGDYKLIMCGGSGGWSFPKPNNKEALEQLPEIQLYNLKNDPGELVNLQSERPNLVTELKALLTKQILDGRSTKGAKQTNDSAEDWSQLWWIDTN
ncbi:arylsulfatase [Formosa agariphila KMM 3901]|uniref:Arylsulfatase n=1 Tax=Formosa agariphila (strain DSM 15362 / KCTC 12365 / LMG 23005 / KMM 3901 / M-2Alg 35-1) TaxID=1347342 RepID=T2KNR7_FORAG|nr:arylsulfatase [Formosa agariphila]CDF79639.1 arylsulfatase [Formosa agariphila KMM 3901]